MVQPAKRPGLDLFQLGTGERPVFNSFKASIEKPVMGFPKTVRPTLDFSPPFPVLGEADPEFEPSFPIRQTFPRQLPGATGTTEEPTPEAPTEFPVFNRPNRPGFFHRVFQPPQLNPGEGLHTPGSAGSLQTPSPANKSPLNQDDAVNFLLAGSKGGKEGTTESIDGRFARPNSRFAKAGANEFDAVVAKLYSEQFKAYALGLDAAFEPGKNINQIASNITKAGQTAFTPEAELLAKVAAVYRGDLTGDNKYNNRVLKDLLVQWGRSDIANKPGVGETDVESIGGVVKALNEQQDPAIRKAWLQQIFDFQNNSPNSPSGAVPNVEAYQKAINIVQNGTLDGLVSNYTKGTKTDGPVDGTPGQGAGTASTIPDVDFRNLDAQQRTDLSGLTDRERAVLHLWGRQMSIVGFENGNIYNTVLEDPGSFKPAEVDLIKQLAVEDTQKFGGITGKALDQEFFKVYQKITGVDISQKYNNAPVHFADGVARFPDGTVDSPEWEAKLEKQNGLNRFENEVLRLWGHNPLFTGHVDGEILPFTLDNAKALDFGVNKNDVRTLLNADLASDGVLNGDSLKNSFLDVLDKVYLNQGGTNANKVTQQAQTQAVQNGRTPQQVQQSLTVGVQEAMKNVGKFMKDHPFLSGMSAGGLMAATAICPFLAGMGAGAMGIAAANMRRGATSS